MTKLINEEGLRIDGRKIDEIRPLKIEVGTIKNADGSAYIDTLSKNFSSHDLYVKINEKN